MSKPTKKETVDFVRKLYNEGQSMRKIGLVFGFCPAWIRILLLKTGSTRPRGYMRKAAPVLAEVAEGEVGGE